MGVIKDFFRSSDILSDKPTEIMNSTSLHQHRNYKAGILSFISLLYVLSVAVVKGYRTVTRY